MSGTQGTAEKMLDDIFSIMEELYREMCLNEKNSGDHLMVYNLFANLGKTLAVADRASFWRWDKSAKKLRTAVATGIEEIVIDDNTGLVGRCLKENRPIVTNDPRNHPDFNAEVDKKTGYITKSVLVMPVSNCRGEVIGAFQVINKLDDEKGFDEAEDVKRLSIAAFICGIALESDIFLEESQRDKLTGLKNRFGFYSDYKNKLKNFQENISSLIICDIDHFKKVNDTYGHNGGDAILTSVAKIFLQEISGIGNVYRWGGEEFVIVLDDKNISAAAQVAESLRRNVENSVCHFEDQDIKVTMSFGCAEIDMKVSIEESIKVADERLYLAKNSGRNLVVSR